MSAYFCSAMYWYGRRTANCVSIFRFRCSGLNDHLRHKEDTSNINNHPKHHHSLSLSSSLYLYHIHHAPQSTHLYPPNPIPPRSDLTHHLPSPPTIHAHFILSSQRKTPLNHPTSPTKLTSRILQPTSKTWYRLRVITNDQSE